MSCLAPFRLALAALALVATSSPAFAAEVDQATVPLTIEGHRPFVDVSFLKPDGSQRVARFLVDTGGGAFLLAEPLARDLGLTWTETSREEGMELAQPRTLPSEPAVGGLALTLNAERVWVVIGKDSILPKAAPGRAEGMLPGHVLATFHVVFDYPKATFTLAKPGVLKPVGQPLPMPVGQPMGFPRTEVKVGGETHGFLLDTGASFTMVSEALLKAWGKAHPEWPRFPGAVGEAATLGGQALETMTLPGGTWGEIALPEFGVVSQRQGVFETYMSKLTAQPIEGALAGNVLERFRVELDYPNQTLYLSRP